MAKTAEHSHTFEVADIEHFQVFADWMNEHLPEADVTYVEKPTYGKPYVMIIVREDYFSYALMLDEGKTFHIGDNEAWITGGLL